jgi:hypothetical protein
MADDSPLLMSLELELVVTDRFALEISFWAWRASSRPRCSRVIWSELRLMLDQCGRQGVSLYRVFRKNIRDSWSQTEEAHHPLTLVTGGGIIPL